MREAEPPLGPDWRNRFISKAWLYRCYSLTQTFSLHTFLVVCIKKPNFCVVPRGLGNTNLVTGLLQFSFPWGEHRATRTHPTTFTWYFSFLLQYALLAYTRIYSYMMSPMDFGVKMVSILSARKCTYQVWAHNFDRFAFFTRCPSCKSNSNQETTQGANRMHFSQTWFGKIISCKNRKFLKIPTSPPTYFVSSANVSCDSYEIRDQTQSFGCKS